MALCKGLVRASVLTALVGGAAVLVAGPERVCAILHQTRDSVNTQLDKVIKDPVALRQQLRDLEGQYPARIGEVRGDLGELKEQIAQLKRDRDVSQRVVELAEADLGQLQPLLARAESQASSASAVYTGSVGQPAVVRIVFNNENLDVKDAYARAEKMQQVRGVYSSRVGDIDRDLGYLSQQEQRLGDLLGQLETEQAKFASQIWDLDRQIDAIGRNERMIEVMEKRQVTIDQHSRYRANSLDQLSARFSEIRTKQESRLEALGKARETMNYESRAKIELDARNSVAKNFSTQPKAIKSNVIEIRPDNDPKAVGPTQAAPRID